MCFKNKTSRILFIIYTVVTIIICVSITLGYISFGVKGVYLDSCRKLVNGTTNETALMSNKNKLFNFCLDYDGISVWLQKNMFIWTHFMFPFFLYIFFASYTFVVLEYKVAQDTGMRPNDNWNRHSFFPYLFSMLFVMGFMQINEMLEIAASYVGKRYFHELIGDMLGDILSHLAAVLWASLLIFIGVFKPNSYLYIVRSTWRIIFYGVIVLLWNAIMLITFVEIEVEGGRVLHIGNSLYIPISFFVGFALIYMDLKDVSHSRDIRRNEVVNFWILMYIFLALMWIPTFELILPTFISLIIGLSVSFPVLLFVKFLILDNFSR